MVGDGRDPAERSARRAGGGQDAHILAGLAEVAARHLAWHGEIRLDQRLVETLRLDSLRLLTLVVEVENHFQICLEDDAGLGLETVRDLVTAIRRELDGTPHAD